MPFFRWLFGKKNLQTQDQKSQGPILQMHDMESPVKESEIQGIELNEIVPEAINIKQGRKDVLSSTSENELAFHTRGQKNPKGLPRVFFACHPDDFELYFQKTVDMVDAFQDVAFFYEQNQKNNSMPWMDLSGRLSDMQLIIMPVSSRILFTENRAVREILPFATEKHIPVLPIMFESGLDEKFQEIFGDLQYLKPENSDVTAIPFEQKLEKYLGGVLIGSEMAQRIRDAFDAYIFLSYRKKDRIYAQELMRMIHKNDRYRDIAIWYDEYLVPGESFNDAIRAALDKGRLFALVVTPSLLEQNNYVMLHEYPAAKDSGKPILPAQMVETDRGKLEACYKEIPDNVDVHDGESWEQALIQYFRKLAVINRCDDPQHTFLIGLAYLDGIDVEVDSQKAEDLITGAADQGLTEAMEKLVAMYHEGKGVERDYRRSTKWQERLVNALHTIWQKSMQQDDLRAYFSALWYLGDAYMDLQDLEAAMNTYKEMKTAAEIQIEKGDSKGLRNLSVSFNKLGNTEKELGNLESAKNYYEKALEIIEKLDRKEDTVELCQDLVVSFNKLGNIEQGLGNLEGAKSYYEKALRIIEKLARRMENIDSRRDLSICLERLGDIEEALGHLEGAKSIYERALEFIEKLAREANTIELYRDLLVIYGRLGDIEKKLGNLESAKRNYEKSFEISEKRASETTTVESRRDLSMIYIKFGDIDQEVENLEGAKRNYKNALEIIEKLAREISTVRSQRDLSVIYSRLGAIEEGLGNPEGAKKNYEKAQEISEKLARRTDTVESRRDLSVGFNKLGNIEKDLGNLDGAKRNYEKAIEIDEQLVRETKTVESRRDLSVSYSYLGDVEEKLENPEGAKRNYEKAIAIRVALARETGTISAYDDLAVSYFKMGTLNGDIDEDYLVRAYKMWDTLAQSFPSMPSFAQRRDAVKRFLQSKWF